MDTEDYEYDQDHWDRPDGSTYEGYKLLSPDPVELWSAQDVEHLIASLEPDYPSLHLHGEVKPFWDQPHLSLGRLLITSDLSDSVYSMYLEKHEGRYEPCYTLTVDSEVGGLTTAPGRSCRQVEAFTVLLTSIA